MSTEVPVGEVNFKFSLTGSHSTHRIGPASVTGYVTVNGAPGSSLENSYTEGKHQDLMAGRGSDTELLSHSVGVNEWISEAGTASQPSRKLGRASGPFGGAVQPQTFQRSVP